MSAALERIGSAFSPIRAICAALYRGKTLQEPFRQLRTQAPVQALTAELQLTTLLEEMACLRKWPA